MSHARSWIQDRITCFIVTFIHISRNAAKALSMLSCPCGGVPQLQGVACLPVGVPGSNLLSTTVTHGLGRGRISTRNQPSLWNLPGLEYCGRLAKANGVGGTYIVLTKVGRVHATSASRYTSRGVCVTQHVKGWMDCWYIPCQAGAVAGWWLARTGQDGTCSIMQGAEDGRADRTENRQFSTALAASTVACRIMGGGQGPRRREHSMLGWYCARRKGAHASTGSKNAQPHDHEASFTNKARETSQSRATASRIPQREVPRALRSLMLVSSKILPKGGKVACISYKGKKIRLQDPDVSARDPDSDSVLRFQRAGGTTGGLKSYFVRFDLVIPLFPRVSTKADPFGKGSRFSRIRVSGSAVAYLSPRPPQPPRPTHPATTIRIVISRTHATRRNGGQLHDLLDLTRMGLWIGGVGVQSWVDWGTVPCHSATNLATVKSELELRLEHGERRARNIRHKSRYTLRDTKGMEQRVRGVVKDNANGVASAADSAMITSSAEQQQHMPNPTPPPPLPLHLLSIVRVAQ
ncbi:hypothetical protein JB92DRAFT_3092670 [Gautieria morchelliformis]|nr:hypothetical protein JB92DRAFT_3092670 [Gautieria morchelliformis]